MALAPGTFAKDQGEEPGPTAVIQIRLRVKNNEAWITAWDDETAKVTEVPLRELVMDAKMDVSYRVESAAKGWS